MATSEVDLDLPVIKALGTRFKLTEVFLWDDGYSNDVEQASLFPKHIRFKYDGDDIDEDDPTQKCRSNSSLETAEDNSTVTDDVELTQQMSALGLPVSFQTDKQNSGQTKVKTKATKLKKNKHNQKELDVQVKESSYMDEESSLSTDLKDKSGNSSSSLLHQTVPSCSGGDLPIEFGNEIVLHALEGHIHANNKICDDIVERNETSVDKSSPERVDIVKDMFGKNELQIEDPGSCDMSGGSQDMVTSNCVSSSESTSEWNAYWDSCYMRYYFYNSETHESTWDPPPGIENLAFADYSCESKEELNEGGEEVPSYENEQVDRCMLASETVSDGQLGVKNDSEKSPSLKQQVEEVNHDLELPGPTDSFNSVVVESCSLSSSTSATKEECTNDGIIHLHLEEMDPAVDVLDIQNTVLSTKRKKSRKKNQRRKKSSKDDNGYQPYQEFDIDITKYWNQRYLLFSKFDDGIKMDEEGWFSVTPEAIAKHHASRSGGGVVLDCFVGVGGNAIQFAKVSKQVIGIDIDSTRIDYAHHNAVIYGVEGKIDFVIGDCFDVATKLSADTVFLSPPWGGPRYAEMDSYDIEMLQPYDGRRLFDVFEGVGSKIVMFLPRNVNVLQLAEVCLNAGARWAVEVEKNYLNGRLKAVTAYYSKIAEN